MQIGTYGSEDEFEEILFSKAIDVDSKYWYDFGTLAPYNGDWNPTQFYTYNPVAPEPSTSILILLGVATLALRRQRVA